MKLRIDNRAVEIAGPATILQVAEANGIYIPHLCSHPELTPYGGCRLCIVEVDGIRGYPTSCTTLAEDGMVVRTQTKTLSEMRREILQLMLSEHPSACLICDEADECRDFQVTIRKVGITTGCRWCPKDEDCELQHVVQSLGIGDITFPVCYRDMPVETQDPFFDHDYNLCVYCGRCVRICQEQRHSSIIAFRQRGRRTTIGPAFGQSHLEANCEFCGACVSVCPTGALAEKNRKWHGGATSFQDSVCPLCSMACDIQVVRAGEKIVGTLPPGDPRQSGGELCVKGRFCLSEWVNHPRRSLTPRRRFPEGLGVISWEEAARQAGSILERGDPARTAVFLSPHLTLEEIAAASLFLQRANLAGHITSSALTRPMASFLSLGQGSPTAKEMEDSADLVLSVFVGGNHNFAPFTLAVKRLAARGIPYIQVGWLADTTSRFASQRLSPPPGEEWLFFQRLASGLSGKGAGPADIRALVASLRGATAPVIVLSGELLNLSAAERLLADIERIAVLAKARLLALHVHGNLPGLLSLVAAEATEDVTARIREGTVDTLYLVGDQPFDSRPNVKTIIHQGAFPPPDALRADLLLPAATFGEVSGSCHDGSGRRKTFARAVPPRGESLPHQEIFSRIAATMDLPGFPPSPEEIARRIPDPPGVILPARGKGKPPAERRARARSRGVFSLLQERTPHIYHGTSLSRIVPGMAAIAPEDTLIMNPADAERMGVSDGKAVVMRAARQERSLAVAIRKIVPPGFVLLRPSDRFFGGTDNPQAVEIAPGAGSENPPPGRRHV
ncbi:MAG: (2Fe-2S)-binding protein [Candidatus Aminicenantes bacterium]|nr:(2Fe-2S)-binding protein [Candidatus Aminicenantes bacterium]